MRANPFTSDMSAQRMVSGEMAITYLAEDGLYHVEILPAVAITHPMPQQKKFSTRWTRLMCGLGQHQWDGPECMTCDRRRS